MKELDEVNCEVRSVIDIQHSVLSHLNNADGDDGGPSNGSQIYNGVDVPCAGFLNDATYAWLSYNCHLVVLNVKNGESISSWTFRGKITSVCQFPAQPGELPLLLVGLDNGANRLKDSIGLLCIFDCSISRVLRAIKMPAGIEQVCIVSGGAEWEEFNDKRPDNILMQMDGIACVVLRNLHHLMIDLQRSSWEVPNSIIVMDETSPAEIEFLTTKDSSLRIQLNKNKHMAFNLLNKRIEKHIGFNSEEFESNAFLDEKLTSCIVSSTKIGCLISGCLGRVIIWQNDGSVGWISLPVDESMVITHLALLEPTDDPRPFYYLWVVFQDESCKVPPLLRMYTLLFDRKYCDRGTNLYFNLTAEPALKFEFELDANDKVVSLSTIEREMHPDQTESESRRGEDSLLLISTTNRTLLFDLNQWYKEQMPQTISECRNPNSILASYDTRHRPHSVVDNEVLSCTYAPRSLQEFPNCSLSSSEELFYPNSLSLEWIELSLTKLTFWLCRGVQAELLREMALAGPIVLTQPSEMFHKCLSIGLVPFNTEISSMSDHNMQKDMLLSLCLEQRWATFLIRCAKEWSDGSAAYLYPSFLKWGIQRASSIKMIADRLCVPLFDQSGNNIGESEIKTLRFCYQQLECLSNIVSKLPPETSNLSKQQRALKRISMYFQVLLWFFDVGLLPESQDLEEGPLPVSLTLKIPYPYKRLFSLYKERRESFKDDKPINENVEVLFIDELISRECPALNLQWERESGDTSTDGYYPPPSLQSLLRSYLTDCDETESSEFESKHQITIYLLMDLVMLLQRSYPNVDQLIKYPSSFKMSPSLIKLTQAFWLLDHEDYQGFLDLMTGQLISDSDVKHWHHKLVLRTLIRNSQHKLALMYLRIKKPPLTSVQDQSTLIGLSVEHGLVQSAFHSRPQSHYSQLLMCFFQACQTYDKLGDTLHLTLDAEEEETFVRFLEESKLDDLRMLYYLQRCRYMEANTGSLTARGALAGPKNLQSDILNAYNATLPEVVKKFSANISKINLDAGMESRYPRPMSHNRTSQRSSNIYETVIRKARETYLRGEKPPAIPFITVPCTTLKLNDDQININCVMYPQVVETTRKRPLEQAHDEEESGMRTSDRAKRRKLLDEGETALSTAFNTPLVKRKLVSNSDTSTETPHSILKIRQLIRNSTSPTMPTLQEVQDNSPCDKEKKINRQIRFSINQSKKNISYDEVDEESSSKLNVSEESGESVFCPANEKSVTDNATLSSSHTCKNVYNARPRPSLRRTCLQMSTESLHDSLPNYSATKNSLNSRSSCSFNALENCSKAAMASPQVTKTRSSLLSSSMYSSAILSSDSSFEPAVPFQESSETSSRQSSKFSKQQDVNSNRFNASTPFVTNTIPDELQHNSEESMNVDEDDSELSYTEKQNASESPHKSTNLYTSDSEMEDNEIVSEEAESKHKNGGVLKNKSLNTLYGQENDCSNKEDDENEEEFESFSNATENSMHFENREHRSWSLHENRKTESDKVQGQANLRNGEHFDITDDESSNSAQEMVLALENSNSSDKHSLQTSPMQVENIYDASNITDDESDSSIELEKKSIHLNTQQTIHEESRHSVKRQEEVEESVCINNNDSVAKEVSEKLESQDTAVTEDNVNTSRLSLESTASLNESVTPRMTRSRRASSISMEPSTPPMTPKVAARNTRSRRASSLVKDVLLAAVGATADEGIKRTLSSDSDGSPKPSTPRKTRGGRASSVTKDASPVETEEEGVRIPVRRSTRRAASVQKELPEPTKPLTKSSRVSSTLSLVENEEEKVQTEAKSSKAKSSNAGRKAIVASTNSKKDTEQDAEESNSVKATRKRGSSVPKETVATGRTRRSSSIAKEIVSQHFELEETIKEPKEIVTKPAANTRGRRSSIQSIPEELEQILSVPQRDRISAASKKKETVKNTRNRRAASVDLSQTETNIRTRNLRSRKILEETIEEEVLLETENQGHTNVSNVKKVPKRRVRALSETPILEVVEEMPKARRTRKTSTKQETSERFSFSRPEKADTPPLDESAIGEVPNFVFSPPHTRSKTTVSDQHRRKVINFVSISSEDETEDEGEQVVQKQVIKPGNYVRVTVQRYRTKFVLPIKKFKSMAN